jgi:glycosyltransferase involved in cell wall biosynthesis
VSVEKNLEALLSLDLPGSTVIVGDGPARRQLERRYPYAYFLGSKQGEKLADIYASADVFVFPSRTDTFGIVMIEAMASGLPVAAYPVPGPIDVVAPGAGVLDEDLRAACLKALTLSRDQAREHSMHFTWRKSARQFLDNIEASRSDLKLMIGPSPRAVRAVRPVKNG